MKDPFYHIQKVWRTMEAKCKEISAHLRLLHSTQCLYCYLVFVDMWRDLNGLLILVMITRPAWLLCLCIQIFLYQNVNFCVVFCVSLAYACCALGILLLSLSHAEDRAREQEKEADKKKAIIDDDPDFKPTRGCFLILYHNKKTTLISHRFLFPRTEMSKNE